MKFSFGAHQDGDYTIIRIKMDDVDAYFKYSDPESIGKLMQNLGAIIDYAINDYTLGKKFKSQIDNELQDWINDDDNSRHSDGQGG